MLMPPVPGKPLKLYISTAEGSIGCLLSQEAEDGTKRAIYYLSRLLNLVESRYTPIEKFVCLYSMLVQNLNIICCLKEY